MPNIIQQTEIFEKCTDCGREYRFAQDGKCYQCSNRLCYCMGYYSLEVRHIAPPFSAPSIDICNDCFKLLNIKVGA